MNWAQHILILDKKANNTQLALMPYLNKIWCKGDKEAYRECVQRLSRGIACLWCVNNYINRDFKNVLMPGCRNIERYQYQTILAFDKYLNDKNRFNGLLSLAKRWIGDEVYIPKKVLKVELFLRNQLCGTAEDIKITNLADGYNENIHLQLKSVVLNSYSSVLNQEILNGNPIEIKIIGELYDQRLYINSASIVSGICVANENANVYSYDQLTIRPSRGYIFNV